MGGRGGGIGERKWREEERERWRRVVVVVTVAAGKGRFLQGVGSKWGVGIFTSLSLDLK